MVSQDGKPYKSKFALIFYWLSISGNPISFNIIKMATRPPTKSHMPYFSINLFFFMMSVFIIYNSNLASYSRRQIKERLKLKFKSIRSASNRILDTC
jgi:hypothetical protein